MHMALRFPVFDIVEPLVGCRPVWKPNSIQLYKASDLQIFRGGSLHMVQSLLTHGKSENTADEKRDMRCFGDLSGPLNYIYYSNTFSFHIV